MACISTSNAALLSIVDLWEEPALSPQSVPHLLPMLILCLSLSPLSSLPRHSRLVTPRHESTGVTSVPVTVGKCFDRYEQSSFHFSLFFFLPLFLSFSLSASVCVCSVGKHRKHPSGRGNAGGQHHHRILMDKYHPGYFGKVGMRHFHYTRNKYHCPSVNLDKLWSLVSEQTRANYKDKTDVAPVIDCVRAGYFKVLGRGMIPQQPVIVKARFFSRIAEEKIKKAGGACVLTA